MVGNFPQAFSHLTLVHAAIDLAEARQATLTRPSTSRGAGRRRCCYFLTTLIFTVSTLGFRRALPR